MGRSANDVGSLRVKYADQTDRLSGDNYMFDDNHNAPDPIDFSFWLLQQDGRSVVVHTGVDHANAQKRDRCIQRDPAEPLAPFGLRTEDIDTLICTHLHFDHAGGLHLFPNATIHPQAAEMAFATGPCMCHDVLRFPYAADHVCEAVQQLYQGCFVFCDGEGQVAPGVTVHCIGGHTRGLRAVRVETVSGALCLASDAAHFYGNRHEGRPLPIVIDMQDMLDGFKTLNKLASRLGVIVPGHDPLVRDYFPSHGQTDFITRLDLGPISGPYS